MTAVRVFEAKDVDRSALAGRRVAIIGYGIQGHAHALNLRDSGVSVVVGLRPDGASAQQAREDGFEVLTVEEATRGADLVALLIPDTVQQAVYGDQVGPNLKTGAALLFAHGFNIHYGQIAPPADADVILVAPKGPGHMVRREFREGKGVPALVAVHQDATGNALQLALAYADGLGSARAGLIQTSFGDETETDLFGEQAVLCGGAAELVKAGFDTLVEAGYAPELAYFECLHELKLIVDLIYAGGLTHMRNRVSDTAEWGDYVSGPRVVAHESRAAMKQILEEVRSGKFAREWIEESNRGAPTFRQYRAKEQAHPIEEVGKRLRSRMAWLQEKPE
jgi:ketol-acid reductoisomerase